MASLLESTASFTTRALGHGLTEAQVTSLVNRGVDNLSKLAFAVTTPGINPTEDALRALVEATNSDRVAGGSVVNQKTNV